MVRKRLIMVRVRGNVCVRQECSYKMKGSQWKILRWMQEQGYLCVYILCIFANTHFPMKNDRQIFFLKVIGFFNVSGKKICIKTL